MKSQMPYKALLILIKGKLISHLDFICFILAEAFAIADTAQSLGSDGKEDMAESVIFNPFKLAAKTSF